MISEKIYLIMLVITILLKILNFILKRCKKSNYRYEKFIEKSNYLASRLFFIYNICFFIINFTTGSAIIAILYIIIKSIICIYSFLFKLEEQIGGDCAMVLTLAFFPLLCLISLIGVGAIMLYIETIIRIVLTL